QLIYFRATTDEFLDWAKGVIHVLFFFVILLPYFIIEAIFSSNPQRKSVEGQLVLITGTGHGIGKLLAFKYAKAGARVIGWDVNEKLNNETIQTINSSGYPTAYGFKVDVSNRQEVMDTAKKIQQDIGDVTILINNAGIMPHHSFLDHTEQEIRRIMDINVMGNFWTLQAFLPTMREKNNGHIVSLSSMAGYVGLINLVPYNASKFAVRGLMEGLYEEFRQYPNNNVNFTTVYPFMVDTGLCTNYEISYELLFPVLKPQFVADAIFEAQTTNRRNVLLPTDIGLVMKLKTRFLPQKACNYISDNFRTNLLSDLHLKTN
ncbi:hypothetical protein HUJ05_007776, partial [Dendroctonus ponderosae]